MKRTARQFVSVRHETRSDNGKESFVITWTPEPGVRKRLTRGSQDEADAEADRIEELLRRGHLSLAKLPASEVMALTMMMESVAPGTSPQQIVQFWLEHHSGQQVIAAATVETVGLGYITSRSSIDDFSVRHIKTVQTHVNRFIREYGSRPYVSLAVDDYAGYLKNEIGGVGKTRMQHLITLRSMSRWARDIGKFLPEGRTAAEQTTSPKVVKSEHDLYSPEEMTRILVFTPTDLVMFVVLGQFAGIRAEERRRLRWSHWRREEGNKIVCNTDVTKTQHRRRVDVLPNLEEWLEKFQGKAGEPMVTCPDPYRAVRAGIKPKCGLKWKHNALRAGYASYHLELFDNAALTAKNDGHTVQELENTYKSISGVTKKTAEAMFSITPQSVLEFAAKHDLPEPEWTTKVLVAQSDEKTVKLN